jgi:hypothetical protein
MKKVTALYLSFKRKLMLLDDPISSPVDTMPNNKK